MGDPGYFFRHLELMEERLRKLEIAYASLLADWRLMQERIEELNKMQTVVDNLEEARKVSVALGQQARRLEEANEQGQGLRLTRWQTRIAAGAFALAVVSPFLSKLVGG